MTFHNAAKTPRPRQATYADLLTQGPNNDPDPDTIVGLLTHLGIGFPQNAGQARRPSTADATDVLRWQARVGTQRFLVMQSSAAADSDQDHAELVGARIRAAMNDAGVSQLELARRTGMARQQIAPYVKGEVLPQIPNLIRIAKALRIPVERLLYDNNDD